MPINFSHNHHHLINSSDFIQLFFEDCLDEAYVDDSKSEYYKLQILRLWCDFWICSDAFSNSESFFIGFKFIWKYKISDGNLTAYLSLCLPEDE